MRTIKFRAWYKSASLMTFSDDTNWGSFGDCELTDMESGQCELMQFTGLQDKNGKEIFEGDIIQANGESWEVRFFEGTFYCFSLSGKHDTVYPKSIRNIRKMYVIGNIHQNPELLK